MHQPICNGKTHEIDLPGCVFAFVKDDNLYGGRPFLLNIEYCQDYFLPIFSTKEKLDELMQKMGYTDYKIKQIMDPIDFLDSLWEQGVRVMYDPIIVNKHRTKWLEVVKKDNIYSLVAQNN